MHVAFQPLPAVPRFSTMDCKHFRKLHLEFLDDTLPGEVMLAAEQHLLVCNSCAAHDTLVRRSLLIARNLPVLEPDEQFQQRLREKLSHCRSPNGHYPAGDELGLDRTRYKRRGIAVAVAASVVMGVFAMSSHESVRHSELSMQPVLAEHGAEVFPSAGRQMNSLTLVDQLYPEALPIRRAHALRAGTAPSGLPATRRAYASPELVQAMATGNPVWPAAIVLDDAPIRLISSQLSLEQH